MKVKIGEPKNWFGPYQLAEALCFWVKSDQSGQKPDWVHNFGEILAYGRVLPEPPEGELFKRHEDAKLTWLYKFLLWIDSKKSRNIKVHIDRWDTWSMDHTLAHIILPMLQQLKATQHGAPNTDDQDVPEHLRSTAAAPKENEYDTDEFHFKRWDYILDEMIFAFKNKLDDSWEDQFKSGTSDIYWKKSEKSFENPVTGKREHTYEMIQRGTREYDWEGHKQYQARISNGFRLFGKYYEALWD